MSDRERSSRSLDRDKVLPYIDKMNYNELISYANIIKKKHNLKSSEEPENNYTGPHTRSRASSIASSITSNAKSQMASPESPPSDNNIKEKSDKSDVFIIKNLPREISEQRDAFRFFSRREMMGNNPFRVMVSWNKSAKLEMRDPMSLAELRKWIRHVAGHPNIEVTDFHSIKNAPREQSSSRSSGPSLSYIIKDVPKAYTDDELKERLIENEVDFQMVRRIISQARQQPTLMVRVVTCNKESYIKKVSNGIFLYGRIHRCEPSLTSQITLPKIKYRNKCCKNGHLWDECPERKIVCPFCGGDHKSTECEKMNEPKCINCQGAHPSFSMKCPERMKTPETPAETAPITPPKVAPLKNLPFENKLMIEHQLLMLMNLMPQNRENIIKLNEFVTKTLYGWKCIHIPSPTGFTLHFSPIESRSD
ncbi:hypothetical protein JTB14_005572 [Gonioctena quinquepunctata]|nr:hypothetical protein JTB14_005572 [Gonioctena quinquepunctata]